MIAYRFQTLPETPRHGVILSQNKPPQPAFFLTPTEAKVLPMQRMTIARIQAAVADYYGLTAEHMRSKSRSRNHVYPRQMAMLLCRELCPNSLPDIGQRFGGRDHSTIFYGIESVRKRIASNPSVEFEYETLRAKLAA